jgi:hypothetical protein
MDNDYSNRTLAYLLLVAIVMSLGGTFISLNKLGAGQPQISGSATSVSGTGALTTGASLGITLITSSIQFGTCVPGNLNTTLLRSNDTSNYNATPYPGACTFSGSNAPQNFTIENTGSVGTNVSIQSDSIQLTGGSNQSLWYAYENATNSPGCNRSTGNTVPRRWLNITSAGVDNVTCAYLMSSSSNKRIWVYLMLYLPSDAAVGTRSATLTFTAKNSYG